ncbi:MAG: hypothetical protein AMXMBFR31_23860 [Candidatus Desulfobacillus denitrificans]
MSNTVLIVFLAVCLGMILGGLPFLQIDRTGIALLGAIALVALGKVSPQEAAQSVHLSTLLLLFSFMVLSAQMRLGGFYTRICWRWPAPPTSARPPTSSSSIARRGIRIDWRAHARVGVPVTLATLAMAAAWLLLRTAR